MKTEKYVSLICGLPEEIIIQILKIEPTELYLLKNVWFLLLFFDTFGTNFIFLWFDIRTELFRV